MNQLESLFGPPISVYTRAQALADGVLVDVTKWASNGPDGMRGGFRLPVAFTAGLWSDLLAIPASQSHQSMRGRAHDVLWLAALAARGRPDDHHIGFQVRMRITGTRKLLERYIVDIGPGDDGEPVVTIGPASDF